MVKKMNIDKIIKNLEKNLVLTYHIDMNQQKLDELIDYCIKNDLREKAWRIALTFSNYDYSKLADYYLKVKDDWYLSELLYVVGEEKIKIYELYNKVLNTKDLQFIEKVQKEFMSYFVLNTKEELLEVLKEN